MALAARGYTEMMTADDYRVDAERCREAARKEWALPEARGILLHLAAAYDLLALATETLARQPAAD